MWSDPSASRGFDREGMRIATSIGVVAFATIAAAWAIQWAGHAPCELCLKQRIPYYGAVPLAAFVAVLAARGRRGLLPAGFAALALIFAASTALAAYHAGVEWHFWTGPESCTGSFSAPAKVDDFLRQLNTASVVRCDAPAVRILGLSLAVWNAAISLVLASVAAWACVRSNER